MRIEEIVIYGTVACFVVLVVYLYQKKNKKKSEITLKKIQVSEEEGRSEPLSLHPYIDLNKCIGSTACISSCPEKDILGVVDGKAYIVNATSCVGHGACFHSCPVEAISLRIGSEKRGVELPHVNPNYESNVKGIYIVGELGGMGLIKNSVEQGKQAVLSIIEGNKKSAEDIMDVVVVGAGPAGIAASLMAKKHNLKAITLDQNSLGGTVFSFPRSKVVMTHHMELPLYGKLKLKNTSKEELLGIWKDALAKNDIPIQEKVKVEEINPMANGTFQVIAANGNSWQTNHVIIAIGRGGSPRKLNVPGEDLEKVAYRLLEPEDIEGKNILVVGGGDSAVESALLLKDENNVTLSYRKNQFVRIKPRNQIALDEAVKKNSLKIIFNSQVKQIAENTIDLSVEDQKKTLKNDLVYIFIGGELPISFLEKAGIQITKKFGQIMKKH